MLICYALVNRPYILDLQSQRSVIRRLLDGGFDVYLIDWAIPNEADRVLRLQDYVGLVKHATAALLKRTQTQRLHLFGYCMGGTMSAMCAALHPQPVHTLTLLATPIDFERDDSLLRVWTQEQYFDVDRLIDTYGNCPAPFLQAAFKMMKPVQNFVEKYSSFFEHMHDEEFLENFFAMETWVEDSVPVAGETFREFVRCLYQKNQLVAGELKLGRRKVNLKRIKCPLLLLTADFDHLVAPGSTLGIIPHVGSSEIGKMQIAAGHVGLAVSSKAHQNLWPAVVSWLADHSTPRD